MESAAPSARYALESTLGQGGMGVVYRALDKATGRVVALKRLVLPGGSADAVTALFEREYHTLTQLSHPAVIRAYDYGVDAQGPYYTMELLEGSDLRGKEGIESGELCEILCGIASALSLLHARRLVHRDVTSGNIRLVAPGRAKLIDFGALAPMGPTDRFVGTPRYAAPEAVLMQPLDGRADLYSLGVVMYRALTGRHPYRARTVHDLRAAWREAPLPPIELSAAVPRMLSDLTMSLIALDPALRPRDATEVMERLAAIGSVPRIDAPEASRAHLVTPTLVGRTESLRRARELVVGALRGKGGALVFTGPSGVGRSRMLDAAALEAQVLGATVVRLGASRLRQTDFGAIEATLGHLRDTGSYPSARLASVAARRPGQGAGLEHLGSSRVEIINGVCRTLVSLSKQHPLVLVADDLQDVDEPSIAALSSLLREVPASRIAFFGAISEQPLPDAALSLRLLLERSTVHRLDALDVRGMRTLVRSLFGAVPHIDALAGKMHRWSRGYPRDAMALAEHLLERGVVSYRAGAFSVPESVEIEALPQSLSATLESRVRTLSPLALSLAQAYAVSGWQSLSLEDCRRICPEATASEIFRAMDALVTADVFGVEGADHVFRHEGWQKTLHDSCSDLERAQRHRTIARVLELRGGDRLAQAYHLMRAGDRAGVELTARCALEFTGQRVDIIRATQLRSGELGWLFSSALDDHQGRDVKDHLTIACLRRFVMVLGVYFDARWYFGVTESVETSLMREAGYYAWESLGDQMEAMPRLFEALRRAQADYDADPDTHLNSPPAAIRHLVQYVVSAIAVGARTSDCELRRRLPRMLAPFAPLSPLVAAMKENSQSAAESTYADYESAATRLEPVVEVLSAPDAASIEHSDEIRAACTYAIGSYRARIGIQEAVAWVDRVAEHPSHASNVRRTRALLALHRGDWAEAEAQQQAAEQYDMEHGSPQLFGRAGLVGEIEVYARGLDLRAIKQLVAAITPHAERHEGWRPHLDYAHGEYERLRGDLPAALAAFDRATSATLPRREGEHPDAGWYAAEAGALETLLELERLPECRARAEHSLRFGDGAARGARYDGVKRALALCEARLGEFDSAVGRLDALIEYRKQIRSSGLGLGLLYEARTMVELWRNERAAAEGFLALAAAEFAPGHGSGFARRLDLLRRRFAEEDRLRATISMLGAERPADEAGRALSQALSTCHDAPGRASRGLGLLCKAAAAAEGHLYLLRRSGIGLVASTGSDAPPSGLDEYLSQRMDLEFGASDADAPMTMVTVAVEPLELLSPFKPSPEARRDFHPVWIRANLGAHTSVVGVAALGFDDSSTPQKAAFAVAAAFGDLLLQAGDTVIIQSDDAMTRADAG